MKYAIRHRYTEAVLFEADIPDDTPSGLQCRVALEKATQAKANLRGSNLSGSDLSGSNLSYSDLSYSNLRGSNLSGSNLSYSNLSGSNLSDSNLSGSNLSGSNLSYSDLSYSNLSGSNLSGAIVRDKKIIGSRPYFQLGPIGSRNAVFVSWITEAGLLLNAGCFWGTVDEFRPQLAATHGYNDHAKEYEMALLMIETHAAIWTPKEAA